MFKNVTFCTRHTGEQRELKTLPHSSPEIEVHPTEWDCYPCFSSRGLLLPLLLQPGAPAAACAQTGSCMKRLPFGDFFFCTHLFKKKKQLNELPCSGVFDSFIGCL